MRTVMLRRPRKKDLQDMRTDPFWEFGSFGLTGCHSKNLLHPKNKEALENTLLVFMQGGQEAIKLMFITWPIRIVKHKNVCEATWSTTRFPFCFDEAPIIINNAGYTDFPEIKKFVSLVDRSTWMGKVSSAFRTRVKPLPLKIVEELSEVYYYRSSGRRTTINYLETLPYLPNKININRKEIYEILRRRANQ